MNPRLTGRGRPQGSIGSSVALFEAVPEKPRTVVSESIVYFIFDPAPSADLAAVSFCGEGLKTVGCCRMPVFQLFGFRDVVSVATKPSGPAAVRVKMSALLVRSTTIFDGDLVLNW